MSFFSTSFNYLLLCIERESYGRHPTKRDKEQLYCHRCVILDPNFIELSLTNRELIYQCAFPMDTPSQNVSNKRASSCESFTQKQEAMCYTWADTARRVNFFFSHWGNYISVFLFSRKKTSRKEFSIWTPCSESSCLFERPFLSLSNRLPPPWAFEL